MKFALITSIMTSIIALIITATTGAQQHSEEKTSDISHSASESKEPMTISTWEKTLASETTKRLGEIRGIKNSLENWRAKSAVFAEAARTNQKAEDFSLYILASGNLHNIEAYFGVFDSMEQINAFRSEDGKYKDFTPWTVTPMYMNCLDRLKNLDAILRPMKQKSSLEYAATQMLAESAKAQRFCWQRAGELSLQIRDENAAAWELTSPFHGEQPSTSKQTFDADKISKEWEAWIKSYNGVRKADIDLLDQSETKYADLASRLDHVSVDICKQGDALKGRVTGYFAIYLRGVEIALHGTYRLEEMLCWNRATYQNQDLSSHILLPCYKEIIGQIEAVAPCSDLLVKAGMSDKDKQVIESIKAGLTELSTKIQARYNELKKG